MKIETFKMERMQSTWENVVDYNLSESGVHPLSLKELASPEEIDEILRTGLGYIQSNGTPELKEEIRKLYPGAKSEQIFVTSGSSEANYLLLWSNIQPGDEVIFMLPNYMQIWGLARGFGARVKPFFLKESLNWAPDLDELKKLATKKTKMIVITNPNNPTGSILSREATETIIDVAEKTGARILADEVYQGAELSGQTTSSFWGKYDKVYVVNGLSKAYGLPGLRVGWIVAPENFIKKTWPYHDYTTISISALSDRLARIALSPSNREKILKRTRHILNTNLPLIESWFQKQARIFRFILPQAGAILFVHYNLKINSTRLVEKLIHEKSVLIVPGDHFEMDHYLRFGYGSDEAYLLGGLERIEETFKELKKNI